MTEFTARKGRSPSHLHVSLSSAFNADAWKEFEDFYREQIRAGCIHWDLDLCQVTFFNNVMLGMLVGLNTILTTREGSLRIVVRSKSPLSQLFSLSRIDRIMSVNEVS